MHMILISESELHSAGAGKRTLKQNRVIRYKPITEMNRLEIVDKIEVIRFDCLFDSQMKKGKIIVLMQKLRTMSAMIAI